MSEKKSPIVQECTAGNKDADYLKTKGGENTDRHASNENKKTTDQTMECTADGDPVNFVTGEVFVNETDFTLPGRIPLI